MNYKDTSVPDFDYRDSKAITGRIMEHFSYDENKPAHDLLTSEAMSVEELRAEVLETIEELQLAGFSNAAYRKGIENFFANNKPGSINTGYELVYDMEGEIREAALAIFEEEHDCPETSYELERIMDNMESEDFSVFTSSAISLMKDSGASNQQLESAVRLAREKLERNSRYSDYSLGILKVCIQLAKYDSLELFDEALKHAKDLQALRGFNSSDVEVEYLQHAMEILLNEGVEGLRAYQRSVGLFK